MTDALPRNISLRRSEYAESDTATGTKNMYSGMKDSLLFLLVRDAARSVRKVFKGTKSTMNLSVFEMLFRKALSEKSAL